MILRHDGEKAFKKKSRMQNLIAWESSPDGTRKLEQSYV